MSPAVPDTQANGIHNTGTGAKFALLEKRIEELEKQLAAVRVQQDPEAAEEEVEWATATLSDQSGLAVDKAGAENAQSGLPDVGDGRYITVYKKWDVDEKDYKETQALFPVKPLERDGTRKGQVLTYRKICDKLNLNFVVDWEIDIEDRALLAELKSCYHEVCPSDEKSWAEEKQTIYFPFRTIIWSYDKLELRGEAAEGDDEATTQLRTDIRTLLQIVREVPPMVDYFRNRESTPDQIAFRFIWTLFPLGTEFVSKKFLDTPQIFKLFGEPAIHDITRTEKNEPLELQGWHYDHTGTDWVRAVHLFEINPYDREKPINSLDIYPVAYHVDGDPSEGAGQRLCDARIAEGKRFIEYCQLEGSQRLRLYDDTIMAPAVSQAGGNLDEPTVRVSANGLRLIRRARVRKQKYKRLKVNSEMIVDPQAWYRQSLELPLGDSNPDLYFENELMRYKRVPVWPEGDWSRLCPPRFFGFMVKEKVSVQLKVSAIADLVPKNAKPFIRDLQLADDSKALLRALVENHFDQKMKEQQMDIVAGKGNTLVILLHGGPGLGKTLTAETLAKATGKPLLTASVGDIGVAAESVESNLERLFERAARWDAILLIDEADAFLEERRESTTPEKNAFVTVMLRILEYYNGIIILTTNRLLALDPAVQSRIHLALYFDNLSPQNLVNIFNDLLERFGVSVDARVELKMWFEVFSMNIKMNGREIRNLVHSAIALARSEGRPVTKADFNAVLSKLRTFHDQLSEKFTEWRIHNSGYTGRGARM